MLMIPRPTGLESGDFAQAAGVYAVGSWRGREEGDVKCETSNVKREGAKGGGLGWASWGQLNCYGKPDCCVEGRTLLARL